MKKVSFYTSFLIVLLLGTQVLAANEAEPSLTLLTSQISSFANVIAGIILGISTLMIVFAGFKYVVSQGDERMMETAKMQIIYAGIGIMISMFSFVILKIFTQVATGENQTEAPVKEVVESAPMDNSPIAIFVFILVSAIIFPVLYKTMKKIIHSEEEMVTVLKDEKQSTIHLTKTEASNAIVVNLEKKEDVSWKQESVNWIVSHKIKDESLKLKTTEALHSINELYFYKEEFDITSIHEMSRLGKDLRKLLISFIEINDENKESYLEKTLTRIDTVKEKANSLLNKIENNRINDLEKNLNLVDKRYKK